MFAFIFDDVCFSEWLVLIAVFMIIMGPRKIPQTARTLGNYYSKLRRTAESFKRQILDMETEFNKAAAEAEREIAEANREFESEGDESSVLPSSDAYYPPETDEYGVPVTESYESDVGANTTEENPQVAQNADSDVKAEPESITEPLKQS